MYLRINEDLMKGNPTNLVEEQEGMVRVKRAVGGDRNRRKTKKGGSKKKLKSKKNKKSKKPKKQTKVGKQNRGGPLWRPHLGYYGCVYSSKKS